MLNIKNILLVTSMIFVSGCITSGTIFDSVETPSEWSPHQSEIIQKSEVDSLRNWWQRFDDPVLNDLVSKAMDNSPTRKIAEAKILEARGIRRAARGALFPKVDLTANAGQQNDGVNDTDGFYEAGFDASYELDIFGKNKKTLTAADENLVSLTEQYRHTTLSLVAEVTRDYIDFRTFQKQAFIAKKNLTIQEKTLELVRNQKEFGEAPQLDVERSENLVNTTKSSIFEFQRLADNARLRLSVLTGYLPDQLMPVLSAEAEIPAGDIKLLLLAPADVITLRPDIGAAVANLNAATSLAEAEATDIFPDFTLRGFFGIAENALLSSDIIWDVAIGAAVNLLDFGRIQGEIDAARALEKRAYESYRLAILEAVTEVETALNDFSRINQQSTHLRNAYINAEKALELSQILYREGEVSFINVLDAERTLSDAQSALVNAQSAQSQSLVRLYKSMGVY